MEKPIIQQLRYNLWANKKMANWLRSIPEDQFSQAAANSFPSLRETVLHIRKGEYGWLNRINGVERPFDIDEPLGQAEILDQLILHSEQLLNHGLSLKAEDWQHIFSFRDGYGPAISYSQLALIQHVCNHSTYHRGQLITMAYQLNLSGFPPNDFILFLRENQ